MERKVKFAILQYIPNYERDEKINVAVILHSPEDEYLNTEIISNFTRLKKFDDEIELSIFKTFLKSIIDEFSYDITKVERMNIKDYSLLDKMTKFYVNQFSFKLNESIIKEDCDSYLEKIKKNFLYFDIEKKKRVSLKDSIEFFNGILKAKNIECEKINSKNSLVGTYDEIINVDLKSNDTYYKFINFNEDNIDSYMATIKMWLFNSIELKKVNKKLVFIIVSSIYNDKVNRFIEMLEEYGTVLKLEDIEKELK